MRHNHLKPYLRRLNGKERSSSVVMCIELAAAVVFQERPFVLIQHGSNEPMAIGKTKREIIDRIIGCEGSGRSFNQWANRIKNRARDHGKHA